MVDIVKQAQELADAGPGRVAVGPTSEIGFQQVLRDARTRVDDNQQATVDAAVAEARSILDEVERMGEDVHPEPTKKRLWKALTGAGAGLSKQAQERQRHKEMLRQSGGGPAAVPVTPAVITALEAAALSAVAPDLDDGARRQLAEPWGQRHLAT